MPDRQALKSAPASVDNDGMARSRLKALVAAPACGAVLAVLLAACSSSTSGSPTTSAATRAFSCDQLPASAVSFVFGPVSGPVSSVSGTTTVCSYRYTTLNGAVIVRVQRSANRSDLARTSRQLAGEGETLAVVAGLGESAVLGTHGQPPFQSAFVGVLQGSTELTVAAGPGATPAEVEGFARYVLPRL